MTNLEPKVYVACLASYNAGTLHGNWIDLDGTEAIEDQISGILKASPESEAEEWAVHDYEDFGGIKLSEYEDIPTVSKLGQAIAEHGEAIATYYSYYETLDDFEEYYQGVFKSEEDFVYEWLEETGKLEAIEKAGLNSFYIDFKQLAHDWFIDSFLSIEISYEKFYVFSRH